MYHGYINNNNVANVLHIVGKKRGRGKMAMKQINRYIDLLH